jgi:hypothetical protein
VVATPKPVNRRSSARRRNLADEEEANANGDSRAARAYRLSLWSLIPGLGLLLGPIAVVLSCVALRGTANDAAARNQAKVGILLGSVVSLTQWLGIALMICGWRSQ